MRFSKEQFLTPIKDKKTYSSSIIISDIKNKTLSLTSERKNTRILSEGNSISPKFVKKYEENLKKLSKKIFWLYDELVNKRDKALEIQIENHQVVIRIKEELNNGKSRCQKYNEEIKLLRQLNNEMFQNFVEDNMKKSLINELKSQIELINTLQNEIDIMQNEKKSEETLIKMNFNKSYHIENQNYKLLKIHKDYMNKIDTISKAINNNDNLINEVRLDMQKLEVENKKYDEEICKINEDIIEKEDELNETLEEYRNGLAKLAKSNHQLEQNEKMLQKLAQDLQNKIHRLDVLLESNAKLERKINLLIEEQENNMKSSYKLEQIKKENHDLKSKLLLQSTNPKVGKLNDNQLLPNDKNIISIPNHQFQSISNINNISDISKTPEKNSGILQNKKIGLSPFNLNDKEKDYKRILLISELERLKVQLNSQANYVSELRKNYDERSRLIEDQKKAINCLEVDIACVDRDFEKSQNIMKAIECNFRTQQFWKKKIDVQNVKIYESWDDFEQMKLYT